MQANLLQRQRVLERLLHQIPRQLFDRSVVNPYTGSRLTRLAHKRVVIAGRHEATRVLLRTLLGLEQDLDIVGEAADGDDTVRLALERGAEIVVLDVNMPRLDGFEAAERIRAAHPHTQLILQTPDPEVADAGREHSLGVRIITKASLRATVEAVRAAALSGDQSAPNSAEASSS